MNPDRQCGSCTMCCKLFAIQALDKPTGVWCPHCAIGKGCTIYAARPEQCAAFYCGWMLDDGWGPEWKPEKSKLVLVADNARNRLLVHVDPAMPAAWKRPPYYQQLQRLMRAVLPKGGQVFIVIKGNITLLLPDGEHDLGPLREDEPIKLNVTAAPGGEYKVRIERKTSPTP